MSLSNPTNEEVRQSFDVIMHAFKDAMDGPELRAECERLRARVSELESQRDAARDAHINAVGRVSELEAAIKTHREQRADDRCIEDDDRLYEALGDGIKCDRRVGDKFEMLRNCMDFINKRCEGGGPWKSYAELENDRNEVAIELEAVAAERDQLKAFKDFVHRRLDSAGIPSYPDGPHSKEGCRIGDRLDIALGTPPGYRRRSHNSRNDCTWNKACEAPSGEATGGQG